MKVLTPAATALLERLCGAGDPWEWSIRDGDGERRLVKSAPLDQAAFTELHDAGFLRPISNGSGWWVSDAGRRAFIKSTDELGDNLVHVGETEPPPKGIDENG